MKISQLKSGRIIVPVLFILLHLLFYFLALQWGHPFTKDSTEYLWQSFNLTHNSSFYCGDMNAPIVQAWFNLRPPAYGFFLSILGLNQVHFNYHTLLIVQLSLSLMNVFIVYHFIRRLIGHNFSLWWMLIPFVGFPTQFVYAGMVMSEILFQTFLLLFIYFMVIYLKRSNTRFLIFAQLCLTTSLLIKPIVWLFPFVALVCLVLYSFKNNVQIISFASFVIPLAAIFWMFNYSKSTVGVYEFSSIQRNLKINYNALAILNEKIGEVAAKKEIINLQDSLAKLPYVESCRKFDDFFITTIEDNFSCAAIAELKGIARFFIWHSRWDVSNFIRGKEVDAVAGSFSSDDVTIQSRWLAYFVFSLVLNLAVLFAFVKFVFNKKVNLSIRSALAILIIYMAIVTGPSASARFRLPIFPLLVVTFVITMNELTKKNERTS